MSAACARMQGVETIYRIDHNDYRLEFAQRTYGAIPINFDKVLIISHCMPLKDAVKGYEIFDECEDDCRKVVLTP